MTAHGELSKAAEAAALDAQRRSEASEAIKRATVQYAGPTLKVAREAAKTAEAAVEAARANVVSIRQQLEAAMAELATAQAAQDLAGATLDAAESFEDNIAQWRKILHTPALCAPTADEIAAAAARLQEARQDMTNAVRLQEAIQNRHKAAERAAIAKNHAEYGAQLRTAADAAEALLAEAIDFADLRWFADRLLYRHEDGREELFDRLSDGQRWKVAISVGAARVRPESGDGTNLLILPQAAWQDLDPDNKDLVNDLAVTEGVAILTAECSRGPLRAVVYGEPDPHSVHESMPSDKHDSSHG
jgi:hypothetical protein